MAAPPAPGGSNPRKFSEKIALHNQKQAEETRAFEQLMTDLTVSRVQFQKVQQLRLSQSRGQYYGGSLPNVNQICNTAAQNEAVFPQTLDPRGTRHHGLVERVHRDRPRISSPHTHRRSAEKHRHCESSSPYGQVYLSPPPDPGWRREPNSPWMEDKRPGFRLMSQLNRTNSDSALHTSVMNPQEAFEPNQNLRVPQRNTSVNEAEDGSGDIFSFPSLNEESLMGARLLPKQLWEAKVQSLASRPKSCEVPGINIYPSPDQTMPLPQYQPCLNSGLGSGLGSGLNSGLNTGGSLPDLTNLHFPPPLSTPIDSEEHYSNHLPHAMMQMGLSSSLSNPSLCSSPRRRPAPISPLTLSPEQRRGAPPTMSPITQGVPLDSSPSSREPPPPYPHYPQSHSAPGQGSMSHNAPGQGSMSHNAPGQQQQQPVSPLQSPKTQTPQTPLSHQNQVQNQVQQTQTPLDYGPGQNLSLFGTDPFMETPFGPSKSLPYQMQSYSFLDGAGVGGNCSFDSSSSSSSLFYNPAPGHHSNSCGPALQHGLHGNANSPQMNQGSSASSFSRPPPMLFPNSALPNIILTDDAVGFSLEDELRIEPLSLDGLSMLSDPELVLPDPAVEDSFRSDRL